MSQMSWFIRNNLICIDNVMFLNTINFNVTNKTPRDLKLKSKALLKFQEELQFINSKFPTGILKIKDLYKLNKLFNDYYDPVDIALNEIYKSNNIKYLKKYKNIYKAFVSRDNLVWNHLQKSTDFEKYLKNKFCSLKIYDDEFESDGPLSLDVSVDFMKKCVLNYLKATRKDFIGSPSDEVKISKMNIINGYNLEDTLPRDAIVLTLIQKSKKTRKGNAPNISATIFKVGTKIIGSDQKLYEVKIFKGTKRWVLLKI